jgi:hypothetical protein
LISKVLISSYFHHYHLIFHAVLFSLLFLISILPSPFIFKTHLFYFNLIFLSIKIRYWFQHRTCSVATCPHRPHVVSCPLVETTLPCTYIIAACMINKYKIMKCYHHLCVWSYERTAKPCTVPPTLRIRMGPTHLCFIDYQGSQ